MNRYICIHGHFYQPPRENPWLEEIEAQDSAYPYHDWNERITVECYAPNTASRILDSSKKIVNIVNNYAGMSFNFGPTLLSWMERYAPEDYQNILNADKESQARFSGHGSAMAQAYNHMLMPLANTRDERTQVYWGIRDFEHRFKRKPVGMWLPETAVNTETLEILADCGIRFTVLAPHQAAKARKIGEQKWVNVEGAKIDPQMPYICVLPSGKMINLFFYDGPISRQLAFEDLLKDGERFARRLVDVFTMDKKQERLVHIATDGESYGHHHKYGDMALAYCLYYLESNKLAKITNYAEFLGKCPPTHEVKIIEDSSWSCSHGVERWKSNCGCCSGRHPAWHQLWREPLRNALDWLRDTAAPLYERHMREFADDPWRIRDHYIEVILDRSTEHVERFLKEQTNGEWTPPQKVKVLKLLELQRHAMLMYTSCGWFFDEISGIETIQILQYAARVIQLTKEIFGDHLEEDFIKMLEKAPSNIEELKNGAGVYERLIKPSKVDLLRVGAHLAVSSIFEKPQNNQKIFCFSVSTEMFDAYEAGKQKVVIGRAKIRSRITWEEDVISFAVLHLGDHNFTIGVRSLMNDADFAKMQKDIKGMVKRGDIRGTIHCIEKYFETSHYTLWHLFKDQQSKIICQILDSTLTEMEGSLKQIYEHHYPVFQAIREVHIPLPKILSSTISVMLSNDILSELGKEQPDFEHLESLVRDVREWPVEIDKETLKFVVRRKTDDLMDRFWAAPRAIEHIKIVEMMLRALDPLSLDLDLWKAQNIYFAVRKQHYTTMKAEAEDGRVESGKWVECFHALGEHLRVKIV